VIFADTSYFIALTDYNDSFHNAAVAFSGNNESPLITTDAIILELGAHYSREARRPTLLRIIDLLKNDAVEILPIDSQLMRRGLERFKLRADKDWSLTDCTSFVIMEDRGLHDAASTDVHFEQAGFVALLRQPAKT
jgi:hypothetical protein